MAGTILSDVSPDFHGQELYELSTGLLHILPQLGGGLGGEGGNFGAGKTRQLYNLPIQLLCEEELEVACFVLHANPL